MQDFEIGSVIVCKQDSEVYKNWINRYAIVLKSKDPMYSCYIRCVNTSTKKCGEGDYAKGFINDNFRLLTKAERVLYAE